jgi:DNA-binding protein
MSQEPNGKVIVIQPSDVSPKITDIVEKIISGILETGEITVIGINDSMFLACSAINMATEIAKVYVNDICVTNIEIPVLGKTYAISAYLAQKQIWDYSKFAEQEEKEMSDIAEQTISVSRGTAMERLLTIALLRFAKFDEVRIVAAGSSINDAVVLALKLTNGQISKDTIGIKLVHLYSILMRNDPTKSIAAVSIYLQKGISTRYVKRQSDLLKKLETLQSLKKESD